MPSNKLSNETLTKLLDIQWQDHFQTRAQTWKTLEITSILAIAVVGIDWQVGNRFATIVACILLIVAAQFGILITLRHRKVEINKFTKISEIEKTLGVLDKEFELPKPLKWWSIFQLSKSNTPLFILRMHFIIQLFAAGYCILRIFSN